MNSILDILYHQINTYPQTKAFNQKKGGDWIHSSAENLLNTANTICASLQKRGIEKGDKIAIISTNRMEWNYIDFACQLGGFINVPMYPTITIEEYAYIFNDADIKMIFCENQMLADKASKANDINKKETPIYTFTETDNYQHFKVFFEEVNLTADLSNVTSGDEICTMIYTSGTTGNPKGVPLSHHNIISNLEGILFALPFKQGEKAMSFLPICHAYERLLVYAYIYRGYEIYYSGNMLTLLNDIKAVAPKLFTTVPRIMQKIHDGILNKKNELSGAQKFIYHHAIRFAHKFGPKDQLTFSQKLSRSLFDRLVYSKWRALLGSNLGFMVSGAASLNETIAKLFWMAKIPVLEGYGMTETSPVISVNSLENFKISSVGRPLANLEVKLSAENEILVKGPSVFTGYYNLPEVTADIFEDGFLKTGDIGKIDEDGYLYITDRKKEVFKTSGGKYIAPQHIENILQRSMFIDQCMVAGENLDAPFALIVPNKDQLRIYCRHKKINPQFIENISEHPELEKKIKREAQKANKHLANFEKIKHFIIIEKPWTVEDGLLTPTLKMKRSKILNREKSVIEKAGLAQ